MVYSPEDVKGVFAHFSCIFFLRSFAHLLVGVVWRIFNVQQYGYIYIFVIADYGVCLWSTVNISLDTKADKLLRICDINI